VHSPGKLTVLRAQLGKEHFSQSIDRFGRDLSISGGELTLDQNDFLFEIGPARSLVGEPCGEVRSLPMSRLQAHGPPIIAGSSSRMPKPKPSLHGGSGSLRPTAEPTQPPQRLPGGSTIRSTDDRRRADS